MTLIPGLNLQKISTLAAHDYNMNKQIGVGTITLSVAATRGMQRPFSYLSNLVSSDQLRQAPYFNNYQLPTKQLS